MVRLRKGKELTTEQEVVYEGTFKQGVFQQNKASLSKEVLLECLSKRLPVNPFLSKSLFQASL